MRSQTDTFVIIELSIAENSLKLASATTNPGNRQKFRVCGKNRGNLDDFARTPSNSHFFVLSFVVRFSEMFFHFFHFHFCNFSFFTFFGR